MCRISTHKYRFDFARCVRKGSNAPRGAVVDVTELGRLGGTAAANRTPEERSEAAKKAVIPQWAKKKAEGRKKAGK